jgi:hypothetical protein
VDSDAAFEAELSSWLARVYDRAERVSRADDHAAAERIVEGQNRLSIGLVLLVGVSIFLLPALGGWPVVAALVLLYGGTTVASTVTAIRIRALEGSPARYAAIRRRHEEAQQAMPLLDLEARAHLIRIMNLSRLEGAPARRALAGELADAASLPALAGWQALSDAAVLLREPPALPVDAYLAEMESARTAPRPHDPRR